MLPLRFRILTKAVKTQSISLASLLKYLHFRSSCPELFCKKDVLKNFTKFTGVSSGTGISCEFCDTLDNAFFAEHFQWLLHHKTCLLYEAVWKFIYLRYIYLLASINNLQGFSDSVLYDYIAMFYWVVSFF